MHLNSKLIVNPNSEYEKFDDIKQNFYHKPFPEKRGEKFNKYKHKISNWITSGIFKSIEFRDNLYKKWKMSPHDSPDYSILGHNLKLYNKYLNQCIRTAKQEFYMREFTKYKNDIRKTWDTLKHILNEKKSKSEFPPYFIDKNRRISGSQNSADLFNEYFIQSDQSLQVKLTLRTNYRLIPTCKIRPRLHFNFIILPRSMLKKSSLIWNPNQAPAMITFLPNNLNILEISCLCR